MPRCARCRTGIPHPIAEKDAGEWFVRCPECGTANVLRVASRATTSLPIVEVIGWKD